MLIMFIKELIVKDLRKYCFILLEKMFLCGNLGKRIKLLGIQILWDDRTWCAAASNNGLQKPANLETG